MDQIRNDVTGHITLKHRPDDPRFSMMISVHRVEKVCSMRYTPSKALFTLIIVCIRVPDTKNDMRISLVKIPDKCFSPLNFRGQGDHPNHFHMITYQIKIWPLDILFVLCTMPERIDKGPFEMDTEYLCTAHFTLGLLYIL